MGRTKLRRDSYGFWHVVYLREGSRSQVWVYAGKSREGAEKRRESPVILKILGFMEGDHESVLHKAFASSRSHGEWFRPTPTLLALVEANCYERLTKVLKKIENPTKLSCGCPTWIVDVDFETDSERSEQRRERVPDPR